MEQDQILHTLAEVATAFAGFTGIVLVLGQRTMGGWGLMEKGYLAVLLFTSLGVVFFAFVLDLASAAHLGPGNAWRLSTVVFATYHLAVMAYGIKSRREGVARGEAELLQKHVTSMLFVCGFAIVFAQYATALGVLSGWIFYF
jgi:hypothetical protein